MGEREGRGGVPTAPRTHLVLDGMRTRGGGRRRASASARQTPKLRNLTAAFSEARVSACVRACLCACRGGGGGVSTEQKLMVHRVCAPSLASTGPKGKEAEVGAVAARCRRPTAQNASSGRPPPPLFRHASPNRHTSFPHNHFRTIHTNRSRLPTAIPSPTPSPTIIIAVTII